MEPIETLSIADTLPESLSGALAYLEVLYTNTVINHKEEPDLIHAIINRLHDTVVEYPLYYPYAEYLLARAKINAANLDWAGR